jgi:hypothetical protein
LRAAVTSGQDESESWNLDDASVQTLQRIAPLWSSTEEDKLPRRLELLASVLFLRRSYAGRNKDAAGLREILRKNGKHYSESEISTALTQLAGHGLLRSTT